MGYGAMQLARARWQQAGMGPPRDIDAAIAVLGERPVASGVNHIDTSDFYGPMSPTRSFEGAASLSDDLVIVHESQRPGAVRMDHGFRLSHAKI